MKKRSAFTLLEIIIVIIIIGVLASLALPRLANMIEKARTAEALSMLATIRASVYRCLLMNNNDATSCTSFGNASGGGDWSMMDIDNPSQSPNSHFFYHGIVWNIGAGPAMRIWATRNSLDNPDGRYAGSIELTDPPSVLFGDNCGWGYYAQFYGACTTS